MLLLLLPFGIRYLISICSVLEHSGFLVIIFMKKAGDIIFTQF